MKKNTANIVLLGDDGKELSDTQKSKKMDGFEANFIRKYNYAFRRMGLMTKPYTGQRSMEWLAKNSDWNEAEKAIIDNAVADNPKFSRDKIAGRLIEKGIL